MKYLFVLLFILTYILGTNQLGYTLESSIYTHFTYMFQHGGIIHLVFNSFAFIAIYRILEKLMTHLVLIIMISIIGFVASFFSMYHEPTVGASSMVYAMLGLFLGFNIWSRKIKIIHTKKYIIFLFGITLSLLLSHYNSHSNFALHVYCLALGFISSSLLILRQ